MEQDAENPIIQRLKLYIEQTGLSLTQFADKACIPRPTFSQLLSGRNKTINNQLLGKLDEHFPDLDIVWLLFGRGEMRQTQNIEISEPQNCHESPLDDVHSSLDNEVRDEPYVPYGREAERRKDIFKEQPSEEPPSIPSWAASVICSSPNSEKSGQPTKRITSIIVLYSDNSFETFTPTEKI